MSDKISPSGDLGIVLARLEGLEQRLDQRMGSMQQDLDRQRGALSEVDQRLRQVEISTAKLMVAVVGGGGVGGLVVVLAQALAGVIK